MNTEQPRTPAHAARPSRIFVLSVLGTLLLGLLVRLYGAQTESLWIDEVMSIDAASRDLLPSLKWLSFADVHPPGYVLMLDGWTWIFGTGAQAVRSLSVFFGVLTILILMWPPVSRRGSQSGWYLILVGLILALHAGHVHYSQEVRSYALLALWSLLFLRQLVVLHDHPKKSTMMTCALIGALGLWVHHFAWVFWGGALVGLCLFCPSNRSQRAWMSASFAAMVCLIAPWIPTLVHQRTGLPSGFTAHLQTTPSLVDLSRTLGPWGGLEYTLVSVVGLFLLLAIFAFFLPRSVPSKEANGDPAESDALPGWKTILILAASSVVMSQVLAPALSSSSLQAEMLGRGAKWAALIAPILALSSLALRYANRFSFMQQFTVEGAVALGMLLAVLVALVTGRLGQPRNALPIVPVLLASIAWRQSKSQTQTGTYRNPILLVGLLIAMPSTVLVQASYVAPRPDFRGAVKMSQAKAHTTIYVIPCFDTPAVQRAVEDLGTQGVSVGPLCPLGQQNKNEAAPNLKTDTVIFSRITHCSQIPQILDTIQPKLSKGINHTEIHSLRGLCLTIPGAP